MLGRSLQRSKAKARTRRRAAFLESVAINQRLAEEREEAENEEETPFADAVSTLTAGRTNASLLESVWQTTNLEEILQKASERADGFAALRNAHFVDTTSTTLIPIVDRIKPEQSTKTHDWFGLSAALDIPQRPEWDSSTTSEELHQKEIKAFRDWRHSLSMLEEQSGVVLSPYEKNLDVWRQLWRVIERSDILLEIVDARNPLMFRSLGLARAVKHSFPSPTIHLLLLNKADLLTEYQRDVWAKYLLRQKLSFVFFSARDEKEEMTTSTNKSDDVTTVDTHEEMLALLRSNERPRQRRQRGRQLRGHVTTSQILPHVLQRTDKRHHDHHVLSTSSTNDDKSVIFELTPEEKERDERIRTQFDESSPIGSSRIFSSSELLDLLCSLRSKILLSKGSWDHGVAMVGTVGFPNVGKSSTINALISRHRLLVSSTPGKTKHFQTMPIPNERRLMLCDCPGLVFPSFASTREAMVCDGILPIAVTSDYMTAVRCLVGRLPRVAFESHYTIDLSPKNDCDDSNDSTEFLLNVLGRARGFRVGHDRVDRSRSARLVLSDYVSGTLCYVHPPPGLLTQKPLHLFNIEPDKDLIETASSQLYSDDNDDDSAWESLDEAEEARGMSDDDNWDSEDLFESPLEKNEYSVQVWIQCCSFDRTTHLSSQLLTENMEGKPLTDGEMFNAEQIAELLQSRREEQRQKVLAQQQHRRQQRRVKAELERIVVSRQTGEKKLLLDDDDCIVEWMPQDNRTRDNDTRQREYPTTSQDNTSKPLTKRQQRRLAKKNGTALSPALDKLRKRNQ